MYIQTSLSGKAKELADKIKNLEKRIEFLEKLILSNVKKNVLRK